MRRKGRKPGTVQRTFGFVRRGGAREGAGRKPKGARALVSHAKRAALAGRDVVHVTMKLLGGLPSLRHRGEKGVLLRCFAAGCERFGFRLIEYSIQSNHLHLIAEAEDRRAMSRGMQGLSVRIAKRLNKHWTRRGQVFADRYHDRILETPREVRHALRYVLHNHRRHGSRSTGVDPFSSGPWFDGWREGSLVPRIAAHLAEARSWLLQHGWRRHGLLSWSEAPGAG